MRVFNSSSSYEGDIIEFIDYPDGYFLQGIVSRTTITKEGEGYVTIGGKTYQVYYSGSSTISENESIARLNYPDSAGNSAIIYPTKNIPLGVKLALYKPITINLTNWDGYNYNLSALLMPNGDGYSNISFYPVNLSIINGIWKIISIPDGVKITSYLNTSSLTNETGFYVGTLYYKARSIGLINHAEIVLTLPSNQTPINNPAVIFFEEKSYKDQKYHALVATLKPGDNTPVNPLRIDDVVRTWKNDSIFGPITATTPIPLFPNNTRKIDLYGSLIYKIIGLNGLYRIVYPDNQRQAYVYVTTNISYLPASCLVPGNIFCYEGDGGKDYFNYSIAQNTQGANNADSCPANYLGKLSELYCAPDGRVISELYTCPNGCQNGRCL